MSNNNPNLSIPTTAQLDQYINTLVDAYAINNPINRNSVQSPPPPNIPPNTSLYSPILSDPDPNINLPVSDLASYLLQRRNAINMPYSSSHPPTRSPPPPPRLRNRTIGSPSVISNITTYNIVKYPKYSLSFDENNIYNDWPLFLNHIYSEPEEYCDNIVDLDSEIFLFDDDFEDESGLTQEDIDNKTVELQSLLDAIDIALDENEVTSEDLDDDFKSYIAGMKTKVSYLISVMFESMNWTFEPIEKILWMYLITASKYEPRAIKYLIKHTSFNKNMLFDEDSLHNSCIIHACRSSNPYLVEEFYYNGIITKEVLTKKISSTSSNVITNSLLQYSVSHSKVFIFLVEHIPEIADVLVQDKTSELTLFYLACIKNTDTAKYLLASNYMNKNYFNKECRDVTCIIVTAVFNPELLPTLLASEYCSDELIKKICGVSSSFLNVLARSSPKIFVDILNSDLIPETVLTPLIQATPYIYMFHLSKSVYIEAFINSKYFNSSLITKGIHYPNHTIFNQLVQKNLLGLKYLLDSPHCTKEVVDEVNKSPNTHCLFLAAEICKVNRHRAVMIIINSNCFSVDLLKQQDYYKRNIFMIIMERDDFNSLDVELINYLLEKCSDIDIINILHQRDTSGLNTFAYLCIKAPSIADKLLSSPLFHESLLEADYLNESSIFNLNQPPMLFPICCMSKDPYLIIKLLNSKFNSTELMKLKNINGNNLLFEIITHNRQHLISVLNCKYMTEELFNSNDSLQNNILIALIVFMDISSKDINVLNTMLEHKYCTKEFFNHKSIDGVTGMSQICSKSNTVDRSVSNIATILINHKHWDSNMYMSYLGVNYLQLVCNVNHNKDASLVKVFGEHSLLTKEMFQYRDPDTGKGCLSYALANNSSITRYISDHKYCTQEMFNTDVKQWFSSSSFSLVCSITNSHVKTMYTILTSKYCTKEIFNLTTINKHTLLMIATMRDLNMVDHILYSPMCSTDLLTAEDVNGQNILHFCINYNKPSLIIKIVDSKYFDISMFKNKDTNGDTILYKILNKKFKDVFSHILKSFNQVDKAEEYRELLTLNNVDHIINRMCEFKIVDEILECPWVTPELLRTTGVLNESCLHSEFINLEDFKKILTSNKCTPELLNTVDSTGNSFLTIHYNLFKETLASEHCTTELLEHTNNQDLSILTILCMYDFESIPDLLADDRVTSNILIPKGGSVFSPLSAALDTDNKALEYILNSDKCTTDIVNRIGSRFGMTILSEAIAHNNYDKVKLILETSNDLTASFNCLNVSNRNVIMLGTNSTLEIFEMLINSKYMKQEMLYTEDELKHNAVCYAFGNSLDIPKLIMESSYWTDELMYHLDIDNDFLLAYANDKPEIVKYVLNNINCTQQLVDMSNKMGMNCAHYFAMQNDQCMRYLIESKFCNDSIISKQDVFNSTCLHKACLHNEQSSYKIIKSKFFTSSLLMKQTTAGMNALMIALSYNSSVAMTILKSELCGPEILLQRDNLGNTTFNYAIKYSSKAVKYIMKQPYFKDDFISTLLNTRTCEYDTPIMIAAKYNSSIVEDILKLEQCTPESLTSGHSDFPSALTIASRYNPEAVKHILNWSKLDWLILNSSNLNSKVHSEYDDSLNFIATACKYNPESLKYALDSTSVDLSIFFELSIPNHPMFIAAKYQPDSVKYILDSKYTMFEFFLIHKDETTTCIDIAFDFQPKGLWNMINSKIITPQILSMIDNTGYTLQQKVYQLYQEVKELTDLKNINLTKYDNIVGNEDSDSNCIMCCEFKKSIVFTCGHMCCVGCAFKLNECHNCRQKIVKKTYLYE